MTSDSATPPLFELDRRPCLFARRDGTVQIGWTPERSVVLTPPHGVDAATMMDALRLLDGRRSVPDLLWRASELGIEASDMRAILTELRENGVVRESPGARRTVRRILIVGRGPLSDAIADGLSSHAVIERRIGSLPRRHRVWDTVVLADRLIPPPTVVDALMRSGTAHLVVRLRDGVGVVGPLVVPGTTSCVRCGELTRCEHDPEWPFLSAQLLDSVGGADPATVSITASLAVSHVIAHLTDSPSCLPASLNRTLEVDVRTSTIARRSWPRHRLCECGLTPTDEPDGNGFDAQRDRRP